MRILLTNDDGIFAPGLESLRNELAKSSDVTVVAPATEQSGVGHSITYLTPLIVKEIDRGDRLRGWAVEGSPADCVKIGVSEFCPEPDLVVSGINSGLNAGINVLYSGTVAAAIEGAFYGITSFAVSLEYDEHADYQRAAEIACSIMRQILAQKSDKPALFNLNMPTSALCEKPQLRVVPMGVRRFGEKFEKRIDPRGRSYYWATGERTPPDAGEETDLSALWEGHITLTPLDFDLTKQAAIGPMRDWRFEI